MEMSTEGLKPVSVRSLLRGRVGRPIQKTLLLRVNQPGAAGEASLRFEVRAEIPG